VGRDALEAELLQKYEHFADLLGYPMSGYSSWTKNRCLIMYEALDVMKEIINELEIENNA
jgi:hypothetical protein